MFIGGCGYFFEGDGSDMLHCFDALSQLPDDTKVYAGHEYALANYEWSSRVERANTKIQERLAWARGERNAGRAITSTVGIEKETNVFMRAESLMSLTGAANPVDSMTTLRQWKNSKKTL